MKCPSPVALLVTAATLTACGGPTPPPTPPPPEVGVVAAQPVSVALQRDLVGRLTAYRTAEVRARVPGVVLERVYREGSDVKAGDLLFRIDPQPLQATLQEQRALLAQAQANATNAERAASRSRELIGRQLVSQQDLDDAEAQERTTAATRLQSQATVRNAELELGYASVTSPIDGRAGKAEVTEGALVGEGDASLLTRIEQLDPIYAEFSQSAADLQALQQAQTENRLQLSSTGEMEVALSYSDGTPYPLKGKLNFADLAVDPATGAVALRAIVPNPERRLLPGMFVQLKLTLGEQQNAYLLPQAAVLRDAQSAYLLVVGPDGKVAQKRVTLGDARGNEWTVTGGLTQGDQVIVSGTQKARAGQPAKAVAWRPAAQNAPPQAAPTAPRPQ